MNYEQRTMNRIIGFVFSTPSSAGG